MAGAFRLAPAILEWFDRHGRHDLPWQKPASPYRVWLSEIMLQQTQVSTVIPYFERFVAAFPDAQSLANASSDKVLSYWSGLGYYARARNLHKTAGQICNLHDGALPDTLDALVALPGIGRSTAGAILAIGFGKQATILDGNVKRVLARFHAVQGWPGEKKVADTLWSMADSHTPRHRVADYTQAIMDLGATVCTRSSPNCSACPLRHHCQAHSMQTVKAFPQSKPRKALPVKEVYLLAMRDTVSGKILLQQRPPTGLWGGLWCFPEAYSVRQASRLCQELCGHPSDTRKTLNSWRHTFSHFHLDIRPILFDVCKKTGRKSGQRWVTHRESSQLGLAAPTTRLLALIETC
jgi:A/G-specific adenine glycosylase